MKPRTLFALALTFALAIPASAASLLVLSKADHTLSVVDPATRHVMARYPSGPDPHEVIASADGRIAYISNYGGGAYNTISVVDLVNKKPLLAIDLGPLRGPHGLFFQGGKLWFTAEGAKAVGSFNPATQKIDWILGTGQDRTHMIFVSPDLKRIVTTNVSSHTVTIADKIMVRGFGGPPPGGPGPGGAPPGGPGGPPPQGPPRPDWQETVVPVGAGSEGFDISPGGAQIWVANSQDGTISIVDATAKKVIQTLEADVKSANRLKFTLDGKRVLVSSLGGPDLAVFDAATGQSVKRIPIGRGAAGIQIEPDGSRAYVACTPDDYVAVVDLSSLSVIGRIEAGGQPDGLAWTMIP
jgi:YVTN family beta-propeller protein